MFVFCISPWGEVHLGLAKQTPILKEICNMLLLKVKIQKYM